MSLLNYIIVILYSLLLPLHILNTMEIGGGIKLFYIPVGLLCIYNFFHLKQFLQGKVLINFLKIGCLSIIPAIIFLSPIGSVVTFMLTFFTLLGLPYINKKLLYTLSPFFLIIANILSFRYADWNGFPWRYQGMYNDPNYYVISLIVGLYLCLKVIETEYKSRFLNYLIKIIAILSILVSLYVILLTQSRGGILAFFLFFAVYIPHFYRVYPKLTIIICLALIVGSGSIYVRFYDNIQAVTSRFSGESESDVNGANSRFVEIEKAFNGIESMPFYLITGAGISASGGEYSEYQNKYRIHNTPIAVLYENGIFALYLFISMLWFQAKQLYKNDFLALALLLAISLQCLTIWTITFLPFWLGLILTIKENFKIYNNNYYLEQI